MRKQILGTFTVAAVTVGLLAGCSSSKPAAESTAAQAVEKTAEAAVEKTTEAEKQELIPMRVMANNAAISQQE